MNNIIEQNSTNHFFIAKNLYKKFSNIEIDFSLSLKENTMCTIIGKSGSGKSTILKLISGLETFSKRNNIKTPLIKIGNKDITNLKPQKRNVGMVFQEHALFPNMNVIQNVSYGLIAKGMKKEEAHERSKKILEKFGLSGFESRNVETLSGGEAQRVSLARTIITKPKLILFDEPLSSLDEELRKQLAHDIRLTQKQEGFTAIFVTHSIEEAISVSDIIVKIENGKKIWEGNTEQFVSNFFTK